MKTSCEFHFGFWDVTAREDAELEVVGNQPFAKIEDINLEEPITFPNVLTLEPDFGWPLDGSRQCFPENPSEYTWGWWSAELSNHNGVFTNPPVLTVCFDQPHSSAGITLTFYATLPKLLNIKWFDLNDTLLANRDFIPDKMQYFCDYQVENYGKVVITVKTMSEIYRFLRCTHILFGVLEVIDGKRVQKAELTEEIDPVALTLPMQTMSLSFYTEDGRFSLLDPSGAYRLFQWKQKLTAYAIADGVRRHMGVFYLQEAEGLVDNIVELSLVDSVGILDTLSYAGGVFERFPLVTLLNELLTSENMDFQLDPSFAGETITGYLPSCTKRQALQQIAFAIGAILDTTRGEVMRIYPASFQASHTIGTDRKLPDHKVTLNELVTRVDVTAHAYRLDVEVRELIKTELTAGQHILHFTAPSKVTAVTGGTLAVSHPNYAVVDVPSDGEVVLTGQTYVDDTAVYTLRAETLPAGTRSSAKSVTSATLVDSSKAAAVAQRLYDYYQLRYTDEGRILPGTEQVGQAVEVQSVGGKSIVGVIERISVNLAGGCLAKIVMRGA